MNDKKKTDVTASKKGQDIQHVTPRSMFNPFEEMEHWLENAFPARWRRRFRGGWPSWDEFALPFEGRAPSVDIIDRDNEIQLRAEIPGVEKKDLDISVTEDSVSIKGSTEHEEVEEKGEYYRRETSSGSFSRTVMLPSEVDSSKVKAKFKNGVLEMTLAKVKQSKRQKISVE
ncbi:MAG: Hsp20/alpha crystallin family protein [Gammaproteobacteria bacterium]